MLNNTELISFCLLADYENLYEAMREIFKLSRSHLKKYKIKKDLGSPVKKMQEVHVHINLINHLKINPIYLGPDLTFIEETDTFLAFCKPEKIHSHPQTYYENDNCLSGLLSKLGSEVLEVNQSSYDRGLLYRLDYETSGLMILAKDEKLYAMARNNLKDVIQNKTYLAVVEGRMKTKGKVQHTLAPKGNKGAVMVSGKETGDIANAYIWPLSYNDDLDISLVKVEIEEGLRHQIRVQLQSCGHPILGDPLYGNRSSVRMHLHCFKYNLFYKGSIFKLQSSPTKDFFLDAFSDIEL